jgi:hypothetical protein
MAPQGIVKTLARSLIFFPFLFICSRSFISTFNLIQLKIADKKQFDALLTKEQYEAFLKTV